MSLQIKTATHPVSDAIRALLPNAFDCHTGPQGTVASAAAEDTTFTLYTVKRCRERGWCLVARKHYASRSALLVHFSECASSDAIFVDTAVVEAGDLYTNGPTAAMLDNDARRWFKYNEIHEAAGAIAETVAAHLRVESA